MADDRTRTGADGGPCAADTAAGNGATAAGTTAVNGGPVGGAGATAAVDGLPRVSAPRPALWLLLLPVLLYCLAPLVADRIEPRILGVPFLLAYIIAVTVVTPLVIWLVSRMDPVFRAGAAEPVPADPPPSSADRNRSDAE